MAPSTWQPHTEMHQLRRCLRSIAKSFASTTHSSTHRAHVSYRCKLKKILQRVVPAGDHTQNSDQAVASKEKHISQGSTVRFALAEDTEHTATPQRNTTLTSSISNDIKHTGSPPLQPSKLIIELFADFDHIGETSEFNLSDFSTTSEQAIVDTPTSQPGLRSILKKRSPEVGLTRDDTTTKSRPMTPSEDTIDRAINAKLRLRASLKTLSRTRNEWSDDDKFRGLLEYILNRKRMSALQWLYYHPEDIAKHETSSHSRWHKNPWKKPLPAFAEKIDWDLDIFKRKTARPLLHSYDIGPLDEPSGVPVQALPPAGVISWAECQGKRKHRSMVGYAMQKTRCVVSWLAHLEPCRRLRYHIGRRIDRNYGEEWPARFRFVQGARQWSCPHQSHGSHIV